MPAPPLFLRSLSAVPFDHASLSSSVPDTPIRTRIFLIFSLIDWTWRRPWIYSCDADARNRRPLRCARLWCCDLDHPHLLLVRGLSSISHLHVVPIFSSKYPIIHSTIYPISSMSSVPRQHTRPHQHPTIHLCPPFISSPFFSSSYQTCIPIPRAHADKQLLSSICFLPRPHMPICMPSRYTFRWRCRSLPFPWTSTLQQLEILLIYSWDAITHAGLACKFLWYGLYLSIDSLTSLYYISLPRRTNSPDGT